MVGLMRLPGTVSLDEVIAAIERDGGVIVENFLSPATIAELRVDLLPKLEVCSTGRDGFSGFRTRRMSALFAKSRRVADVVTHPLLLGAAEHFINIRSSMARASMCAQSAQACASASRR